MVLRFRYVPTQPGARHLNLKEAPALKRGINRQSTHGDTKMEQGFEFKAILKVREAEPDDAQWLI